MREIANQEIEVQEILTYKITGRKATYEFLIERTQDETYRAYLLRMWGDADTGSPRKETRTSYTNADDAHNFYITKSPAPQSWEEALEAAWQWVNEVDQRIGVEDQDYDSYWLLRAQAKKQDETRTGSRWPRVMKMTREVWDQIEASVGSKRAETGGALGGSREGYVVEHFYFDRSSAQSGATYSPDDGELNRMFRDEWNPDGINLLGFVHSHPPGVWRPSSGDLVYARRILQAIPNLDYLLLPIVQSKADTGRFTIHAYAVVRMQDDVEIVQLETEIVPTLPPVRIYLDPDDFSPTATNTSLGLSTVLDAGKDARANDDTARI